LKLTERQLQRVLQDKKYWVEIAAGILAEHPQNAPRETDSAIAEIGSMPQSLGRIHESRLLQRTRVRFPLVPGKGPRSVPMIAEVETVSPERGVLLSQTEALRLRRQWDKGRLCAQQQIQNGESGQVGMDHPGQSCNQAHPVTSHDEFVIATHGDDEEEEEEEEERSNPLFRQNSAGARSISTSQRTRERER
jgi:hypothetical protein